MKIQSPWMGRIKGSAGNMTGCKIYDKNIMRAKAFEVNNPNTEAQQVQRGYFADLTKLVASFTPEQLRTLFPSKPKAMSRRNALAKQIAEYNTMSGTEKVVDFTEIDTLGNAPKNSLPSVSMEIREENVIFDWNNAELPSQEDVNNLIVISVINETKKQILLINTKGNAVDEEFSMTKPADWETTDTSHAFMLIANTTDVNADFGSFIIKVRPEKNSN